MIVVWWAQSKTLFLPDILYSPVSWLLPLLMLRADDALEPTVSTRSNPGGVFKGASMAMGGRKFSSAGRLAKGLRIGIVVVINAVGTANA